MHSVIAGLITGLGLIVAIGAQNVYVLRQGIRRDRVLLVVTVCAVSDLILIAVGVAGLGRVIESHEWLITAARIAGAAFLACYAILAAKRALRPSGEAMTADEPTHSLNQGSGSPVLTRTGPRRTGQSSVLTVATTALALTWLNPHVYLDTLFLLGSIAATHGPERWQFAGGAMIGSVVWFSALGYAARWLSRWLSTPRAWRILDGLIAVAMAALAAGLLAGI